MKNTKYPFLRDGEEKVFSKDILDKVALLKAQNRHIPIKCDVGFKLFLARDTKASRACLRNLLGDLRRINKIFSNIKTIFCIHHAVLMIQTKLFVFE